MPENLTNLTKQEAFQQNLQFSISGIVRDNDIIKLPWGKTDKWNLILSPKYIGDEQPGQETDDAFLKFTLSFEELPDKSGWEVKVKCKYRYSVTGDGKWVEREAYYLAVPK